MPTIISPVPAGSLHQTNMRQRLWLPTVGPSATWVYRRLAEVAIRRPAGATVERADLAASIGLSRRGFETSSPMQTALRRLVYFGLARWTGRYAVRTTAPPLSQRHVSRLPVDLQTVHHTLVAVRQPRQATTPPPAHTDRNQP
jgi:hypothetical protein